MNAMSDEMETPRTPKAFIVESVDSEDFYKRRWEGRFVEEAVRLMDGRTEYRIAITRKWFERAIRSASKSTAAIFHISAHGNRNSIKLTSDEVVRWQTLANLFEDAEFAPTVLVMSSCIGGSRRVASAFASNADYRPEYIFGSEASTNKDTLAFQSVCAAWSTLYSVLLPTVDVPRIKLAIDSMNSMFPHEFVYRRWDTEKGNYVRYPGK